MRPWLRTLLALGLISVTVSAQPDTAGWGRPSLPYDGQFTFVRLRWRGGTYGALPEHPGVNFWLHEFPQAEQNLIEVIDFLTHIRARTDGSLNLAFDNPLLFRHPIARLWEPGFWVMTDRDATRLREYLLKGGFIIFNDFELEQWKNFEAQMKRVVPDGRWVRLTGDHPIFNSFFNLAAIDTPNALQHHLSGLKPEYFGLFEQNDPDRRLIAVAAYNTNLAEYWQMANTGLFPVDTSNEAFKLGVNFMLYGMTH